MSTIIIENVRISYPHLWKKDAYGDSTPKYNAQFIINKKKNKAQVEQIEAVIEKLAEENHKGSRKSMYTPFVDGDELNETLDEDEQKVELGNAFKLTAKNSNKPAVVDNKTQRVDEEDPIGQRLTRGGDFVNAKIRFYYWQRDSFKGVLASLEAVQWASEGDLFGGSDESGPDFQVIEEDDLTAEEKEFLTQ